MQNLSFCIKTKPETGQNMSGEKIAIPTLLFTCEGEVYDDEEETNKQAGRLEGGSSCSRLT